MNNREQSLPLLQSTKEIAATPQAMASVAWGLAAPLVVALLPGLPQFGSPGHGVPRCGVPSPPQKSCQRSDVARGPPPSAGHRVRGGACFLCDWKGRGPVLECVRDERAGDGNLKPVEGVGLASLLTPRRHACLHVAAALLRGDVPPRRPLSH